MKEIKRDYYLNQLIKKQGNGQIKVITGIRRSGKSYLLNKLFKNYLINNKVDNKHIIYMSFETKENEKYKNSDLLLLFLKSQITDKKKYYFLLDEIQEVDDFVPVLNSLIHIENVDVYVTGSNSKLLSKDVLTEFRGRGDEIHVYPLSFSEYVSAYGEDLDKAYESYSLYGGLPFLFSLDDDKDKMLYLKNLIKETYIKDIIERNSINNKNDLDELLEVIASTSSSLTNPSKLANTFNSEKKSNISNKTVDKYLEYFENAFIINKVQRFDIKGKKYIGSPYKYYFEDIGIKNAILNFRQIDDGSIMENIIYNELLRRNYSVDIGVVETNERNKSGQNIKPKYEVDFIVNLGNKKYYIQSAYQMNNEEKISQETKSLRNIYDSFKKIIIVKDNIKTRIDENGIITMGLYDFLLNENSLD